MVESAVTDIKPIRLAILQSHPIQYFSPWYKALADRPELKLKVYYCHRPTPEQQGADFGLSYEWDTPLLEGYDAEFLNNRAKHPGLHFCGCDTPEISQLVASGHFDAWLVPGWHLKSYWQLMLACWRHNVPILVRGDSHLLDPKPFYIRFVKKLILSQVIPKFSGYLTVGKLNENYYKHYGADVARFFPARHFVNNKWFEERSEEARKQKDDIRKNWGVNDDEFVALFVGKFIKLKRIIDLLTALKILYGKNFRAVGVLIGAGEMEHELREFSRHNKLNVHFVGFLNQTQLPACYAAADVLVLPSAKETWGLVVNEAMACSLPAVVSDRVGCGPDLVENDVTGYIYPVGDAAELARCLSRAAHDKAKLNQLRRGALSRIQSYSLYSAVDGLIKALGAIKNQV